MSCPSYDSHCAHRSQYDFPGHLYFNEDRHDLSPTVLSRHYATSFRHNWSLHVRISIEPHEFTDTYVGFMSSTSHSKKIFDCFTQMQPPIYASISFQSSGCLTSLLQSCPGIDKQQHVISTSNSLQFALPLFHTQPEIHLAEIRHASHHPRDGQAPPRSTTAHSTTCSLSGATPIDTQSLLPLPPLSDSDARVNPRVGFADHCERRHAQQAPAD